MNQWFQKKIETIFGKERREPSRRRRPALGVNAAHRLSQFAKYSEIKQILDRIVTAQKNEGIKSLALISEEPGQGKTFLASTLAIAYANLIRSKVLLVDTVVQSNPDSLEIDQVFEPDEISLAEGGALHKTLVVGVDTLRLRDWKRGDDGEVDQAPEYRIAELVETFGSRYGLILFDTSPLSARNRNNVDALAVARRCQGSIVVVSPQNANRSSLAAIQERLRQERIQLFGVIENEAGE